MMYRDRSDAGRRLAARLLGYRNEHPVVLALARGGVPVGFEVAEALDAPLDVLLVRKIGVPFQPELALGAVIDGDKPETFIDEEVVSALEIPEDYVRDETARQLAEIERRRKIYLANRAPVSIVGRTAIVVDDGIATGATTRVALRAVARRHPAKVILAVPVAPPHAVEELQPEVDAIVCLATPVGFHAIGCFYDDFAQVNDETVVHLLRARSSRIESQVAAPARRTAR
jgi:putative phosphoribosyl transferase